MEYNIWSCELYQLTKRGCFCIQINVLCLLFILFCVCVKYPFSWLMLKLTVTKNKISKTTYSFIRSIRTIRFSITTPFVGYTKIIWTFKIRFGRTGSWWASLFISHIATIIISITAPTFLYASTISTSKFIGATGFV